MRRDWADADTIARYLGITKTDVFYNLLSLITQQGWRQKALLGDDEIIKTIKELPEYQKIIKKHEICKDGPDRIKLGIWFIQKIGDYELAKKVLEAAHNALEIAK